MNGKQDNTEITENTENTELLWLVQMIWQTSWNLKEQRRTSHVCHTLLCIFYSLGFTYWLDCFCAQVSVWQACMIAHVTLHNFIIEVLLAPTLVIHCSPDWCSIVCRHVCCMWCSLMVTCVCLAVSMQLVLVLYIADSPPTCSGMAQVGFEYCTWRNPLLLCWTVFFCVTPFRLTD